jgi:nitroreductase
MWMAVAPLYLVIAAKYHRMTGKYGDRRVRYSMIEAGHIAQNRFLQAEALDLKAGVVGAYHVDKLVVIMNLPRTHEPLLVKPVGHPGEARRVAAALSRFTAIAPGMHDTQKVAELFWGNQPGQFLGPDVGQNR